MDKTAGNVPQSAATHPRAPVSAGASSLVYAGICNLPLELLITIFTYIPPGPRLRVVSLVCKQWRMLALRSITSYDTPVPRQPPVPETLSHLSTFPALQDLTLCGYYGFSDPLLLPSSLTRLAISNNVACINEFHFEEPLPSLRALEFTPWQAADAGTYVLPLLEASLTSLTSLGIPGYLFEYGASFFNSAHFPELVDLILHFTREPKEKAVRGAFMERHSSKLASLTLRGTATPLIGYEFPNLLSLQTDGPSPAILRRVVANSPKLIDISVRDEMSIRIVPDERRSLIVELRDADFRPANLALLNQCSRLRRLVSYVSTMDFDHIDWLLLAALGYGRLVSELVLECNKYEQLVAVCRACCNLTSLTVHLDGRSDVAAPLSLSLPRLHSLTLIRVTGCHHSILHSFARSIISVCPALKELSLVLNALMELEVCASLQEFLFAVVALGIPRTSLKLANATMQSLERVTDAARSTSKGWATIATSLNY